MRKLIYAFAVFNSAISPYLYGYFSFDLKKELKLLLGLSLDDGTDKQSLTVSAPMMIRFVMVVLIKVADFKVMTYKKFVLKQELLVKSSRVVRFITVSKDKVFAGRCIRQAGW